MGLIYLESAVLVFTQFTAAGFFNVPRVEVRREMTALTAVARQLLLAERTNKQW